MDVTVVKAGTRVVHVHKPPTFFDTIFQPKYICVILTVVNLLNYCDRGIVPGSTNEFDSFIIKTLNVSKPDVYLGLLQSAFIVGFSLASIACGHAVHYYPPFWLCGIGLSVWCVAVLLSGLSFYMESYTFLLLARMLSGCGEASFQCSVPPWIQSTMPPDSTGMWLSLFYTSIPVGTAVGYVYSAMISESIGVKWAFIFECFMMAPFVVYLFSVSPRYPSLNKPAKKQGLADEDSEALIGGNYDRDDIDSINNKSAKGSDDENTRDTEASMDSTGDAIKKHSQPSMWQELVAIYSRPVYICVVLGYAAQTGSLIGVSTFGSAFLMGIGFYETETDASTIFGILISVAGIVGTLSGGYLLDKRMNRDQARQRSERSSMDLSLEELSIRKRTEAKEVKNSQIVTACTMMLISNTLGALLMWSVYFIYDKSLYMITIGAGCALIFFATPAISIAAMNAVKPANRAFAMAMMSVVLHALGDVPSPVVAGLLKDSLAPNCIGVSAASPQCREDGQGLRLTMLIIGLWLGWVIVCFGVARFIATKPALRCDEDDINDPLLDETLDAPLVCH
jgi:predicted MFS family arabinose efflux permease